MRTCIIQPNLLNASNRRETSDALDEAVSLVDALDVTVVECIQVNLQKINAGQYFGSGKVDDLARTLKDQEIDLVVLNGTLTPVQQRNLERAWKVKVLDRTALILEIFGKRARTKEGVLQVDLAHLTYQRSRLVRSWTHLERQRGGGGFMGGPGETQIESDRRGIDNAIIRLKRQLEKVVRTRELHRSARKKVPYPIVALVGYTNAGKSSIFNKMTGASVFEKDMVFATLDPTMRAIELPSGRKVILSDTVGFISDLPTQLVAAFRATLEEVLDADLLLHVRDISHGETDFQAENVEAVLGELGISKKSQESMLEVWNKEDLLDVEARSVRRTLADRQDQTILTSAHSGFGLTELLAKIEHELSATSFTDICELGHDEGRLRAWLYDKNLVVSEEQHEDFGRMTLRWDVADKRKFEALRSAEN